MQFSRINSKLKIKSYKFDINVIALIDLKVRKSIFYIIESIFQRLVREYNI